MSDDNDERRKLDLARGRAMVSMRIQVLLSEAAILSVHYAEPEDDFLAAAKDAIDSVRTRYAQEVACFYGTEVFKIAG